MSYQFDTSLPAYKEVQQGLGNKQRAVLQAIEFMSIHYTDKMCNDRMISEWLKWPINRVTNRRGELLTMGKIIECGKYLDKVTGRKTIFYKVNNGELF